MVYTCVLRKRGICVGPVWLPGKTIACREKGKNVVENGLTLLTTVMNIYASSILLLEDRIDA